MMQSRNKRVAYVGIMACLGIIFGYIEFILPINIGIPGVKLGLSNIVSVVALYILGLPYALIITVIRIVISSLLFGNLFSMFYSLTGALFSVFTMACFRRFNCFSIIGVSSAGGIVHNIGQLLVAVCVVDSLNLFFYFPILVFSGLVAGILIGLLSKIICGRIKI